MIFVVNGAPGSGKTLFEETIREYSIIPIVLISSVHFVKKIAMDCGWDGTKTAKNRKFLSDLKALLKEWDDVPFKSTVKEVRSALLYFKEEPVIFIDCREPEEIEKFCKELGAKAILIRREITEAAFASNASDDFTNILNYNYDYVIENNGSYEEFITKAINFYKQITEKTSD